MARLFSMKNIRWMMIAILLVSLIPLLWISFYSFPLADDFSFSGPGRHAWNETHSVWAVAKAIAHTIQDYFLHWQGSYFSTLLGCLQPALLGERFYFLTTWLLLLASFVGTFSFVRSFFRHGLKQSNNFIADIVACVILLLFIQWIPSPVQAFFWWDGAVVYTGVHMLMMCLLAGVVNCLANDRIKPLKVCLMVLLALLIGGGNYITGLLQCELMVLAVLYAFLQKKNVRFGMLLVTLAAIAGLLINVLAPGNSFRQSSYQGMSLLASLGASFSTAFTFCKIWVVRILPGLLFLAPILWLVPVQNACKKLWLLPVLVVLGYCLQASMYEPTFFAIGIKGEQRIDNVRYYTFILHCMLWLFVAVQQVKWLWEKRHEAADAQTKHPKWVRVFAAVTAVVILLTGGLMVYERKHYTNIFSSLSAASSIYSGDAREYRRVCYERLAILQSDEPNVLLPAHRNIPYVLQWADITTDPTFWVNTTLAEFYQKESVAVVQ